MMVHYLRCFAGLTLLAFAENDFYFFCGDVRMEHMAL